MVNKANDTSLPPNAEKLIFVLSAEGRWDDKTDAIARYALDDSKNTVRIHFKRDPERRYNYKADRVRILNAIRKFDANAHRVRIDGHLLSVVDLIVKYDGFYAIFAHGQRKTFADSQIVIERNVAAESGCKVALDYFAAIANLVSIKTDDGQSLLGKQYDRLTWVPETTVLGAYLTPGSKLKESIIQEPLIFPFGTNASQKIAVEKVFESNVSLIQGPPGTGKTQTILNIISNAIRFGLSIAIVSNNNAATKNVSTNLRRNNLTSCLHLSDGRPTKRRLFMVNQTTLTGYVLPRNQKKK